MISTTIHSKFKFTIFSEWKKFYAIAIFTTNTPSLLGRSNSVSNRDKIFMMIRLLEFGKYSNRVSLKFLIESNVLVDHPEDEFLLMPSNVSKLSYTKVKSHDPFSTSSHFTNTIMTIDHPQVPLYSMSCLMWLAQPIFNLILHLESIQCYWQFYDSYILFLRS